MLSFSLHLKKVQSIKQALRRRQLIRFFELQENVRISIIFLKQLTPIIILL